MSVVSLGPLGILVIRSRVRHIASSDFHKNCEALMVK